MNWIHHPTTLSGPQVTLVPLNETHFPAIIELAQHPDIWTHFPMDVNGLDRNALLDNLQHKLVKRDAGDFYPFVIVLKQSQLPIGMTMLWNLNAAHRNLEIGGSWLHPDHWGSNINMECKYLLLRFCFETLDTIRVQLRASVMNTRSRKAIEKLGAVFEGVLRKDKIMSDGSQRNCAFYSITDDEWPAVKTHLLQQLDIQPAPAPSFEKMTMADAPQMLELLNYYIMESLANFTDEKRTADVFEQIIRDCKTLPRYVIRLKDELIGFGYATPFRPAPVFAHAACFTYWLKPGFTGQGIGRQLFDRLLAGCLEQGVYNILVNVSSANKVSMDFHLRLGFEPCGNMRDIVHKHGQELDMHWFQRIYH